MDIKENAIELVRKMRPHTRSYYGGRKNLIPSIEEAKVIAIIAVDEILKIEVSSDVFNYWISVRNAIGNLKMNDVIDYYAEVLKVYPDAKELDNETEDAYATQWWISDGHGNDISSDCDLGKNAWKSAYCRIIEKIE